MLEGLTVFLFIKDFEMGGLRRIDAKNFGRIVKKCLGLPNTVRQSFISLYIFLSLPDSLVVVLFVSFCNYGQSVAASWLIYKTSFFLIHFFPEFHSAMHRSKGCLRRLIIQAKEGFHG